MTAPFNPEVSQIISAQPRPSVIGGVASSGSVRWAPQGTPYPENSVEPLDDDFISLGRVHPMGIHRDELRETTDHFDWGGSLVAVLQPRYTLAVNFTLMQVMNPNVQKAAHGQANVVYEKATTEHGNRFTTYLNPEILDTGVWCFNVFYRGVTGRLVMPYARPIQVVGPSWTQREIATFNLTVKAMPNDTNQYAFEYWDDGSKLLPPTP